jgi:hypothetical protein
MFRIPDFVGPEFAETVLWFDRAVGPGPEATVEQSMEGVLPERDFTLWNPGELAVENPKVAL